jgi:hypothetical protein
MHNTKALVLYCRTVYLKRSRNFGYILNLRYIHCNRLGWTADIDLRICKQQQRCNEKKPTHMPLDQLFIRAGQAEEEPEECSRALGSRKVSGGADN